MGRLARREVRYGGAMFDDDEIKLVMGQLQDPAGLVPGPRVQEFERRVADYMGKRHGVMVNSGSSALLIAPRLANLPRGSEVITPALTFSSDVAAIYQAGYTPVFLDAGGARRRRGPTSRSRASRSFTSSRRSATAAWSSSTMMPCWIAR